MRRENLLKIISGQAMNKFMVNCKSRPDTPAGTMKMGVHQRRTAHVIAWEFIPGQVLTFTNMKTLTTIPAPGPAPIASGINVRNKDNF